MRKYISFCVFIVFILCVQKSASQTTAFRKDSFADHWQYVGIAIEEPGFHIWGSSPIMDETGKVHLFVARWSNKLGVDPGWRSHSEIVHYVANKPEGPFKFVEVVLTGSGKDTWDKYGVCNPAIHKVGNKYVLLYIANDNYKSPPHSSNQKIGMMVAESLKGPWKKVGKDGLLLKPSENKFFWTNKSKCGVTNPALLQHPNGGYLLYFKAKTDEGIKMGVAFAEQIEGPYVQFPEPVTKNDMPIEDGYAFVYQNKICLLTTDNIGLLKRGGGILWKSEDGINFTEREPGFNLFVDYVGKEALVNGKMLYGTDLKFERPQVLLINDEPAYLYVPSGINKDGNDGTASYILKFKSYVK